LIKNDAKETNKEEEELVNEMELKVTDVIDDQVKVEVNKQEPEDVNTSEGEDFVRVDKDAVDNTEDVKQVDTVQLLDVAYQQSSDSHPDFINESTLDSTEAAVAPIEVLIDESELESSKIADLIVSEPEVEETANEVAGNSLDVKMLDIAEESQPLTVEESKHDQDGIVEDASIEQDSERTQLIVDENFESIEVDTGVDSAVVVDTVEEVNEADILSADTIEQETEMPPSDESNQKAEESLTSMPVDDAVKDPTVDVDVDAVEELNETGFLLADTIEQEAEIPPSDESNQKVEESSSIPVGDAVKDPTYVGGLQEIKSIVDNTEQGGDIQDTPSVVKVDSFQTEVADEVIDSNSIELSPPIHFDNSSSEDHMVLPLEKGSSVLPLPLINIEVPINSNIVVKDEPVLLDYAVFPRGGRVSKPNSKAFDGSLLTSSPWKGRNPLLQNNSILAGQADMKYSVLINNIPPTYGSCFPLKLPHTKTSPNRATIILHSPIVLQKLVLLHMWLLKDDDLLGKSCAPWEVSVKGWTRDPTRRLFGKVAKDIQEVDLGIHHLQFNEIVNTSAGTEMSVNSTTSSAVVLVPAVPPLQAVTLTVL